MFTNGTMDVSSLPFPEIIRNGFEPGCLPNPRVDLQEKDVLAIGYSREQLAAAIETHHPRYRHFDEAAES